MDLLPDLVVHQCYGGVKIDLRALNYKCGNTAGNI